MTPKRPRRFLTLLLCSKSEVTLCHNEYCYEILELHLPRSFFSYFSMEVKAPYIFSQYKRFFDNNRIRGRNRRKLYGALQTEYILSNRSVDGSLTCALHIIKSDSWKWGDDCRSSWRYALPQKCED